MGGETPVNIHIKTEIHHGKELEKIEFYTLGKCFEKEGSTYLSYSEEQEFGKVNTILKFNTKDALLMRSGAVKMRQRFIPNEATVTNYETQFGTLQLFSTTKALSISTKDASGKLVIIYDLQIDTEQTHSHTLTINYKEAK